MSKHTPGPWAIRFYATDDSPEELARLGLKPVRLLDNAGGMAVSTENGRIALVECQASYKRGQGHAAECAERDANARLIAAAPDLLTMIRIAASQLETGVDPLQVAQQCRAAIAKAESA